MPTSVKRPLPIDRGRGRARPARWFALAAVGTLMLAGCTSRSHSTVTVTSDKLGAGSSVPAGTLPTSSPGSASSSMTMTSNATATPSAPSKVPTGAQPDGFLPTKLKPGQKPPQFIILSFDGVGWHDKWQYWKSIQDRVPLHFTGFLSGTYMLSTATRTKYTGPNRKPGKASIGFSEPADLPVEMADLNDALARGDEIGTHFVGHFCSDNPPGGKDWNTSDWNEELDQFFSLVKNVNVNNDVAAKLDLHGDEVKGERTPCLEGRKADLYPALQAHGMTYDPSITRNGLYWPTQTAQYTAAGYKIWEIGMSQFPMEGPVLDYPSHHKQITMDYNFYYSQRHNESNGVTAAQSAKDSAQVLATYNAMFDAVHTGNRAPLILGNHFESWNHNAYTTALGNFVLAKCGQPDVKCLPFRDLIAWMNVQDPSMLARLQAQKPEFGNPSH